jgi:hypothetical protein
MHNIAHARRLLILLWLVLSIGWMAADQSVRDGDEEGHVGAAELYLPDLARRDLSALVAKTWLGDGMGEYPQASATITAGWWWLQDGGLPGRPAVRVICLLGLLLAAGSTGRLARRFCPPDQADLGELAATGGVLLLPLGNGLARHFMPEGLLTGVVALALLAAVRASERPSVGRVVVLGITIGAGLLVKQTFVLVVAVPLLAVLLALGRAGYRWVFGALLAAAATAGPWLLTRLGSQTEYLSQSFSGHGDAGWLAHLSYYPLTGAWLGLGPVLSLASILSLIVLIKRGERRALWLGLLWLIGGLLLLTLVPKKYPRLLAPVLPAAALWWAAAVVRTQHARLWMAGTGLLAAAWLVAASTIGLPVQVAPAGVDPGCPQEWLRAPQPSDLGLSAVEAAMPETSVTTRVQVIGSPEIPCSVQTTYTWHRHLRPYLSRAGHEAVVQTDPTLPSDLIVDWTSGPGERVDVLALESGFWIRRPVLR